MVCLELRNNRPLQIWLSTLKRESQLLEECYYQSSVFVNATFSPEVKKDVIFDRRDNPDQFAFITHSSNWPAISRKISQETGAELKVKD